MTDFPENNTQQTPLNREGVPVVEDNYNDDEFSTVFGDPVEHRKTAEKAKPKKRLLSVIASFLAVAVLIGGTVAVIKLIPEKEEETVDNYTDTIPVLELETTDISTVTVNNSIGSFKLVAVEVPATSTEETSSEEEAEVETVWTVEGVDSSLTSSSTISGIVSSAASISAVSEITEKTASECGLDNPVCSVTLTTKENETHTIEIGSSPSETMSYMRVSSQDKIYLTDASVLTDFEFELLDLADTTAMAGITVTDAMSEYATDGSLTSFDKITLTGDNFEKPVVIASSSNDSELSQYFAYSIISPEERIADNVDGILSLFTGGVSVSGAYSYDLSKSSLAAVGLDKPFLTATIEVAGYTQTYKIAKVDDTYCAVINNDSVMIRKVEAANLAFLDYTAENYYSNMVYLEALMDVTEFTLTSGEESYHFTVAYDEEAEEDNFTITHNGEQITAGFFQNFYQDFVGVTFTDYKTDCNVSSPDLTVTLKFLDGRTDTVTYQKDSATKYACAINGKVMGRVSSTDYTTLLNDIRNVAQNKDIP